MCAVCVCTAVTVTLLVLPIACSVSGSIRNLIRPMYCALNYSYIN